MLRQVSAELGKMHDAGTFGGVRVPFARKIQIDGLSWENTYIYLCIVDLRACLCHSPEVAGGP